MAVKNRKNDCREIPKMSEKSARIILDSQDSYKLIYIIIMSAPLILALQILLLKENVNTGLLELKDFRDIRIDHMLLFITFLGIFNRFFLGEVRYLDSRYIEALHDHYDPSKYRQLSRVIDFYFLVIHAIFFYMLASAISRFTYFYIIFTFIMFFNSLWLIISFHTVPKEDRKKTEIRNTLKWAINNIITFFMLCLFFILSNSLSWAVSIYVFFVIANTNSILDYALTWDTYFPKIE